LRVWDVTVFDEDVACGDGDVKGITGCPFDDAEGGADSLIGDGLRTRGWVVAVSPTASWLPDLFADGILKDAIGGTHPHPHMKVNVLYIALRFLRRLHYPSRWARSRD
jgi:hypothetical protein